MMLPQEQFRTEPKRPKKSALMMPPIYVVPTWMKVVVGALCTAVVCLGMWSAFLQMQLQTNDAKWFVTAKELAELKGRLQ